MVETDTASYSVKLNSLDLQCFHLASNTIKYGRRGTYKTLFSQSSHWKGFPVTSQRFTEYIFSAIFLLALTLGDKFDLSALQKSPAKKYY